MNNWILTKIRARKRRKASLYWDASTLEDKKLADKIALDLAYKLLIGQKEPTNGYVEAKGFDWFISNDKTHISYCLTCLGYDISHLINGEYCHTCKSLKQLYEINTASVEAYQKMLRENGKGD